MLLFNTKKSLLLISSESGSNWQTPPGVDCCTIPTSNHLQQKKAPNAFKMHSIRLEMPYSFSI